MFDVTTFILRWLYLCNLIQNVAEVQILPYTPQESASRHPPPPPPPPPPPQQLNQSSTAWGQKQQQQQQQQEQEQQQVQAELPPHFTHWKDEYLRGITSFPPGRQRLYAIDTLRYELIRQLSHHLTESDTVVKRFARSQRAAEEDEARQRSEDGTATTISTDGTGTTDEYSNSIHDDDDPFLDADLEIVKALEEATRLKDEDDTDVKVPLNSEDDSSEEADALLVAPQKDTKEADRIANVRPEDDRIRESQQQVEKDTIPTRLELEVAHKSLTAFRDYLPQMVSAILKSPGALQPHLLDPLQKLRSLLLRRCVKEANWGIELCWLLEAEVGRAWKKLFEHRQQTGKRLIVVLPAEKAAVIAKIGSEKREAFDLLQDVEQATAYGYTISAHQQLQMPGMISSTYGSDQTQIDPDGDPMPARLPSSLSLRRCSHFGDTMHFIDRLTQLSLDLRQVQPIHRTVRFLLVHLCVCASVAFSVLCKVDRVSHNTIPPPPSVPLILLLVLVFPPSTPFWYQAYLQEQLEEMNRRLRRRMVTRGDVSLDVEDGLAHTDWPHMSDVSVDLLKHSVHFPLEPMVSCTIPFRTSSDACLCHCPYVHVCHSTNTQRDYTLFVTTAFLIVVHLGCHLEHFVCIGGYPQNINRV